MTIRRLSHHGLCVSDLERALPFYRDGLGFAEVSRLRFADAGTQKLLGIPGVVLEAVYLRRDGTTLELLHFPQPGTQLAAGPRPLNQVGLTHLSFLVSDLDGVLAKLRALGGDGARGDASRQPGEGLERDLRHRPRRHAHRAGRGRLRPGGLPAARLS